METFERQSDENKVESFYNENKTISSRRKWFNNIILRWAFKGLLATAPVLPVIPTTGCNEVDTTSDQKSVNDQYEAPSASDVSIKDLETSNTNEELSNLLIVSSYEFNSRFFKAKLLSPIEEQNIERYFTIQFLDSEKSVFDETPYVMPENHDDSTIKLGISSVPDSAKYLQIVELKDNSFPSSEILERPDQSKAKELMDF